MRKHILWYLKGLKSSNELKQLATKLSDFEDVLRLTDEMKRRCV